MTDGRTDRQTELRWLRRAIAVPAVARKNDSTKILARIALSQTPAYTARPQGSASRGVSVYAAAFTGTYGAYPRRDGQAELR